MGAREFFEMEDAILKALSEYKEDLIKIGYLKCW
jgi:hypothetical protein